MLSRRTALIGCLVAIAALLAVASTPIGWRTAVVVLPGEERHDLDALDPHFRASLAALFDDLRDQGYHPVVRTTWRDARRQALYHRLGGSQRARGSLHQVGVDGTPAALAADVGDLWPLFDFDHYAAFYVAMREAAPAHGLVTGGAWSRSNPRWAAYDLGWDPGHVQAGSPVRTEH